MLVSYTAALPSFVLTLFPLFYLPLRSSTHAVSSSLLVSDWRPLLCDVLLPHHGSGGGLRVGPAVPDLLDVLCSPCFPSPRDASSSHGTRAHHLLGAVLIGTSILGTLFFPVVADLPRFGYHLLAHALSVLMSGTFAAASFLALQGILLNTVGQRVFRRITPFLQGGSMMLLLQCCCSIPRYVIHHAAADIRQHCGSLFSALLVPGRLRAHPARAVRTADLQPACPHRLQRADAHALDRGY